MALRQIRTLGDAVLEKKCREIKEVTPRIRELIDDMLDTMYEAQGVGLAAPQVTYLMHDLQAAGWDIPMEATTVTEAAEAIRNYLG